MLDGERERESLYPSVCRRVRLSVGLSAFPLFCFLAVDRHVHCLLGIEVKVKTDRIWAICNTSLGPLGRSRAEDLRDLSVSHLLYESATLSASFGASSLNQTGAFQVSPAWKDRFILSIQLFGIAVPWDSWSAERKRSFVLTFLDLL